MKKLILCSFVFAFLWGSLGCASTPTVLQAGTPTSPPDEYDSFSTAMPNDSARLPVTWSQLDLSGRLIYAIGGVDANNNYDVQIHRLNLTDGIVNVLYRAPIGGNIYYTSVSRDGQRLAMSYSPPSGSDPNVVQGIYVMSADGLATPQLLFTPPTPQDQYTQVEWSPDGQYVYCTHVNYVLPDDDNNRVTPLYTIYRMHYPDGQLELVAEQAFWPRLSPDGSRLVYVSIDPLSEEQELQLADADGQNSHAVPLSGPYIPEEKSAPLFAPDGKSLLFSGNVEGESYLPNLWDRLAGVTPVRADDENSDWWSVPIEGGKITKLTNIRHAGLYASPSPDRMFLAIFSKDNIFAMRPDGTDLTVLLGGLRGFPGTITWVP